MSYARPSERHRTRVGAEYDKRQRALAKSVTRLLSRRLVSHQRYLTACDCPNLFNILS
jgi:hypothetical protein